MEKRVVRDPRRRCFWVLNPERVVVRSAPPLVGTKTRTVTGATKPAHPKGRTGLASSHLTSRRKLPHEGRKSLCRSGCGQSHLGGGLGPRTLGWSQQRRGKKGAGEAFGSDP